MSYTPKNANGQATMANSEPVVIASDQSAVPVSGTVTANLSATDNAVLDAIEADTTTIAGAIAGTEMQVDVLTMPTVTVNTHAVTATDLDIRNLVNTDVVTAELSAVDNAVLDAIAASVAAIDTDTTTLIGHVDGLETSNSAIQTAVQLIDDTVQVLGTDVYTEATSKGITLGAVRRDADTTLVGTTNEFTPLQVDANGRLKVEAFSGETLPVSLTSTTITGTVAVSATDLDIRNLVAATDIVDLGGSALTALQLIDNAVSGAGFNTSQINGVTPLMGSGATGTGSLRVTAATDSPEVTSLGIMDDWDNAASDGASVSGDVAHDTVDTGEPVKIGMKAYELDGTAPQTAVAEADRVNAISDLVGRQYVATEHPRFWHVSADYASAQTNASVKVAPGASLAIYITDILISNGATAGNVTLLDGSGGTVLVEVYPGVNGGAVMNLKNPIKLTDNTALVITSTTVTTHSVTLSGFID
jgi:hypothetical protein